MEQIAGQWPTYGYRRLTAQLRRAGAGAVNGKRVRRLMGEWGLRGQAPARRCRTTNSNHPYPRYPNRVAALVITEPDAVWGADMPISRMCASTSSSSSCIWYLAVLMDVHTRAIPAPFGAGTSGAIWRHLDQALTVAALERALSTGRHPTIHHSDQGVQYAATAYIARLEQVGAGGSRWERRSGWPSKGNRVRTAMPNGYAERLCRTAMPNGYAERLCRTAMPNG